MRLRIRPIVCAALLLALGGCQLARDLLPRTHTVSRSPDSRSIAFVHQQLNSDPPDDHLYLGAIGHDPRHLMALAPDADWCRTIVWSPDSRLVGFLINEQRLAVFDVNTGRLATTLVLVSADGYPGSQEARQVSVGNDGTVTFDRYARATTMLRTARGTVEAPVTIFGAYGRPIHRAERYLGRERLQLLRPLAASRPID